ncbi:putative secreted protein [Treponema sp. JC4]|uniref:DUF2259 domain-containing protein n=1 Tax=Treponema sp. JC4 TaxID=1124982 RepID=UPI00025B09DF|nr:DUF2259 domain-containing protein [Treponema sp. JC4]EID86213.1 putative secreted protein [Treponema sp. JC4]
MKKSFLCSFAFLLAATALNAGDVASFVDKGFSADGKYYVFAQYGKTDKKFQGWAEIYQVDIAANDYVDSGVFKTRPSAATADKNGKAVYDELEAKSASYINGLNCKRANAEHVLYILDDVHKTGTDEIVFKDFTSADLENQNSYRITLVPTINGKGKNARSSFYINLEKYDADGYVLSTQRIGSPSISRKGVTNYKIERIFRDECGKNLIFVIEKHYEDDAGLSVRYMVEAAKLR